MPPTIDPRRTLPNPDAPVRPAQVVIGTAALRKHASTNAELVTQALYGERLVVAAEEASFALVQLDADGYVGWAPMDAFSEPAGPARYRVQALRTYVFSEPDIKSAPLHVISMNAPVTAAGEQNGFVRSALGGWVHRGHLTDLTEYGDDPAAVAERFIGTPYLWGGRDSIGLDCTGLTQTVFAACGIQLPRDSDMQWAEAGAEIEDWRAPGALERNDLVFWRGHVGLMLEPDTLIHANAHHMAVAKEPLTQAITRIADLYDAPIGARRVNLR